MRAIQIAEFGGPEVLQLVDIPVPEPGEGEVLIEVSHAGVNFADTHQRENSYLARYDLPLVPGTEVAGTLPDGQRVMALTGTGGYAQYAVAPASQTFPIPDGVDDAVALAIVVQGLTAWHLYRTSAGLRPGESVVVIAASGGVGNLAVQLAKPFGAGRVIATASSEEKRQQALSLGADAALDPNMDDLGAAIREANGGKRVDIVLEMAGGRVFDECLSVLAPFGRLVTQRNGRGKVASLLVDRPVSWTITAWKPPLLKRPSVISALGRVTSGWRANARSSLGHGRRRPASPQVFQAPSRPWAARSAVS